MWFLILLTFISSEYFQINKISTHNHSFKKIILCMNPLDFFVHIAYQFIKSWFDTYASIIFYCMLFHTDFFMIHDAEIKVVHIIFHSSWGVIRFSCHYSQQCEKSSMHILQLCRYNILFSTQHLCIHPFNNNFVMFSLFQRTLFACRCWFTLLSAWNDNF